MMVVTPSCRCSARISWRRCTRTVASSADSGSSSSSSPGEVASARASAMRCCCPPDSCAGYLASLPGRPTSASSSSTRLRTSARGMRAVHQPIGHVVGDVQVGEQRVGLEDDAVVALRRRQRGDVLAAQLDAPGGLRLQPGDDAQDGRLAAARGAEEADELALRDLQVDALQRDEVAELLADAGQSQKGGRGGEPDDAAPPAAAITSSARSSRCSACSTRPGCARGCRRPSRSPSSPGAARSPSARWPAARPRPAAR